MTKYHIFLILVHVCLAPFTGVSLLAAAYAAWHGELDPAISAWAAGFILLAIHITLYLSWT